ncbi:Uncharacterised protein [Candidatus Anstonella stagnisolia]|nr:Uncharacterised protein [Candidatus Anstonella stagnisolia]
MFLNLCNHNNSMVSIHISENTKCPPTIGSGQNIFNRLPMLSSVFYFRELNFKQVPRFPRAIYKGKGAENLTLPQSDKEENMSYFIIRESSNRLVGSVAVNPVKKLATYLFILPQMRANGYGQLAIEALEQYAMENNWAKVRSHVPSYRVDTLAFLEGRGWIRFGPYLSKLHKKYFYVMEKRFPKS